MEAVNTFSRSIENVSPVTGHSIFTDPIWRQRRQLLFSSRHLANKVKSTVAFELN
jgi:hypothetical protein